MTRGELTPRQAMELLEAWGKWHARRDEIILAAAAARVSIAEMHKLTGLSRDTIAKIISTIPDD